ncbi:MULTISPECIES: GNAT family N-acetyltransferase [unclassified Wolbachia]|nr:MULTISPECIES: GNAT family N-acetyltransferase [unclassified Wolbachia]
MILNKLLQVVAVLLSMVQFTLTCFADYRRKGMGKQLMEEVHDYGREMHCKIATVATMNFQKAKVFYEKLGYKCDLVRPGYVNMYIFEESVVRCTVK